MMLVYFITIIVAATWLLKMVSSKKLIFKRTPLDFPILAFLAANILSTIFSIDAHTSIWGYYSRSNGGLLSLFAYLLLYYALVSNFDGKQAVKFLKVALAGGLVAALWAIPEHFGASPSCLIVIGKFNAGCWVQDVQARVFSTLGQPNWLAAYLAMLIFPALYFLLTTKTYLRTICYLLLVTILYLAFTFTYSRGATLGLTAGMIVFLIMLLLPHIKSNANLKSYTALGIVLAGFLVINLLFASALTSFRLFSMFAPATRPAISLNQPAGTQLENGGTESGTIRLIVWRGALDIFKAYPILGSGVETFAYSYYKYRPTQHNLVSEWDFLYNKAHNEFLNYLATTGLIGFISYMALIISFIIWCIRYYAASLKQKHSYTIYYLPSTILGAYVSYLIQNFFGFSVVITALFFFLFPAMLFVLTDSVSDSTFPKQLYALRSTLYDIIYRRPFYTRFTQAIIILVFGLMLYTLAKYYLADTLYAAGNRSSENNNVGKAYNLLSEAVKLNPGEPLYRSEMAYAAAASSLALSSEDATTSTRLKNEAIKNTQEILDKSPQNVVLYRTAIRTYFMLSTNDPLYHQKTLDVLNSAINLAPTDPKLYYNKAIIIGDNNINEAISALEQSVKLKPNYHEALYSLGLFYYDAGKYNEAASQMKKILQLIPNEPAATEKLKEWGVQ